MNKRRLIAVAIGLLCAFLLINSALAMSSTNYRLDWFTPGTSGGGGPMSSTNYAVNVTVGQTAIGTASSTNYGVGLGYWYGVVMGGKVYLPLIMR